MTRALVKPRRPQGGKLRLHRLLQAAGGGEIIRWDDVYGTMNLGTMLIGTTKERKIGPILRLEGASRSSLRPDHQRFLRPAGLSPVDSRDTRIRINSPRRRPDAKKQLFFASFMVGETRFELATLCSQSWKLSCKNNNIAVKQGENRAFYIKGLRRACKTAAPLSAWGYEMRGGILVRRHIRQKTAERAGTLCGGQFNSSAAIRVLYLSENSGASVVMAGGGA